MAFYTIEGTWEEIKRHEAELVGSYLHVTVKPKKAPTRQNRQTGAESDLGKYSFVGGGSEEFAKGKQAEIEREDRAR